MRFSTKRRPKGFSLIEAAIVLGIVGLVIGGIWTAAAAVAKRQKIQNVLTTFSTVVEKARIFMKNSGAETDLVPTLRGAAFPGGFRIGALSDPFTSPGTMGYYSPQTWLENGTTYMAFTLQPTISPSNSYFYGEIYFNIPAAAATPITDYLPNNEMCIELTKFLLSQHLGTSPSSGAHTSINWVYTSGPSVLGWSFGTTKPDVASNCINAVGLMFYWNL